MQIYFNCIMHTTQGCIQPVFMLSCNLIVAKLLFEKMFAKNLVLNPFQNANIKFCLSLIVNIMFNVFAFWPVGQTKQEN